MKCILIIMLLCLIIMGMMSCSDDRSGVRQPSRPGVSIDSGSFKKVKVVDQNGYSRIIKVDTMFKKGDIIKLNGETLAIN